MPTIIFGELNIFHWKTGCNEISQLYILLQEIEDQDIMQLQIRVGLHKIYID